MRFSQSDSFTISFWAKPVSSYGCVISKMQGTDTGGIFGYMVYWDPSKDTFLFMAERSGTGTTTLYTFDNSAPADSWYFVTAVYDNKNMKIYLNGLLHNTGTFGYDTGSTTPDQDLSIGVQRVGASTIRHYFDGSVDDVRIYNSALTAGAVNQLYNAGL